MTWRNILNKVLVQLAILLLKAGFEWLDVNNDGGISKTEIKQRAKEVRQIVKGL